jgi:hypothetical protein
MGVHEDQARNALHIPNFSEFFVFLSKTDKYSYSELASEAVEVATVHHNIDALGQLALLEVDSFYAERLFDEVMQALVDLNAIPTATTIVVFGKTKLETEAKWYAFATALLNREKYISVKDIFDYIKQPYQRSEIAKKCLDKISPVQALLEWLEWFDRYAQESNDVSSELIKSAVGALSSCTYFDKACQQLAKMKATSGKKILLEKLYLNLLEGSRNTDILCLEQILPEQQRWLTALRRLPDDESQFAAIENVSDSSAAQRLITPAVTQLIQRQLHQEDESLSKSVAQAADSTRKYIQITLRAGCTTCIQLGRLDAAIQLLARIGGTDRTHYLLLLTQQPLQPRQYQLILPFITSLSSPAYYYETDEAKILKEIPPDIVNEERKKRAQVIIQEAEAAFGKLNKVPSRHPQFSAICKAVDKLIEHNELGCALSLCHKLVACNQRDRYANRLYQRVLSCGDFALATQCCELFRDNQHRKNMATYSQYYRKRNYRAALSSLMQLENRYGYLPYIYACAETILTTEDAHSASQFLESKRILTLPEDLEGTEDDEAIKKRILQQLVSNCKDPIALKKLIDRLGTSKNEKIAVNLLTILLEKDLLLAAIHLLNLNVKENDGRSELPRDLIELMSHYLKTHQPTVEQLKILSEIHNKALLYDLIRASFYSFSLKFARENLEIIVAIPDPEQRSQFLIETIVLAICQGDFQFAESVATHLDKKNKTVWLEIITHAKLNNCVELLDILAAETIKDDRLFKWVSDRWVKKVKSLNIIFDYLLKLLRQLALLKNNQPKEGFEAVMSHLVKISFYEALFYHLFDAWYQSLKRILAYSELVAGMATLLPEAKKVTISHQLLAPLREATDWLIENNLSDAFAAIKLLIDYETSFPDYFLSQVIDKLLKQNALKTACAVMELAGSKQISYWHECTALKIAERYLQQGDHATVVRLLKPYRSSYSARSKITDWVVTIINNGKLEDAKLLIDELLPEIQERDCEKIINALIIKKYVIPASSLMPKIKTASLQLRLKQDLQQAYLLNLEQWIGPECARSLCDAHKKLVEFLQLVKNPEQLEKANRLKNEIIVELRSLLDKSFLSFYRKNYGEPPMHRDNILNVFFPVIPKLKGKTVQERLQDYFTHKLKIPTFANKFPALFAYILSIQPLHNPNYLWLSQLYALANLQKHDKNIPLEPTIEGKKINMVEYLPKLLVGINELLLKLFHPTCDNRLVADLCFTNFVPLEPLKLNPADAQHHLMLLRPPSPPRPLPNPPAAPPNAKNPVFVQ